MAKVSTRCTGVATTAAQVIATPGGQSALYAAVQGVLDPGDHAIVVAPYYATYPGTFRAAGADFTVVEAAAEDGFQPRAEAIEKALTPKTRAILLNTPNNPTGAVYSRAALEGIAELCRRHDLWLLSDEVYWTLGGGEHVSPRALDGMAERTLVINSLSKSHGMTGWRIGWLTGPADLITLLVSLNLVSTYGLNDFVSRAAIAALENDYGVEEIAALYAGRRTGLPRRDARHEQHHRARLRRRHVCHARHPRDRARLREIRLGPARRREGRGHAGLELRRGRRRPYPHQPLPARRRAEGRRQPHPPLRRGLREQGRVSNLPPKARAVIIGGGVSGCSVAYHLAKLGWTDIVLLERKQLTSGTTWHAAGLIGQLRGSQNMTRLAKYSADLYVKLEAETGVATGMRQVGSITVALTEERKHEIYRQASLARAFDVDVREISPAEVKEMYPHLNTDGVVGAVHLPLDGQCDPANIAMALAKGARQRGAKIVEGVKVTSGSHQKDGRVTGVSWAQGRRAGHDRGRHRRQLRRHVGARARRA